MISELRDYLQTHRRAPLGDIALHLKVEPDAARGMLEIFLRKGKVVRIDDAAGCNSGCSKCDPATLEAYQWRDD